MIIDLEQYKKSLSKSFWKGVITGAMISGFTILAALLAVGFGWL